MPPCRWVVVSELSDPGALPSERASDEATMTAQQQLALARLDSGLARLGAAERDRLARKTMWLSHHWPDDYGERCVRIGHHHVCRRCAALYPLGIVIAVLSVLGAPPWPMSWDPWAIWLLCLPATIAYVAEAVGLWPYHARFQVGTMLITAVGFGRALGYELETRWSSEFWGPVAVFGGIWFFATLIAHLRRPAR